MKHRIAAYFFLALMLCKLLVWCAGCHALPKAKATHDNTTIIRANEGAAIDSVNAADKKTETLRIDPETSAPAKQTLAAVHDDHKAAMSALAGNSKPLASVDANADQLQTQYEKEHNTLGNRIERWIIGALWWIGGAIILFGVAGAFLQFTAAGPPLISGVVGVVGHLGLGLITGFIPHVVHAIGWLAAKVIHLHTPSPNVASGA